jgi:hypothetical protein
VIAQLRPMPRHHQRDRNRSQPIERRNPLHAAQPSTSSREISVTSPQIPLKNSWISHPGTAHGARLN